MHSKDLGLLAEQTVVLDCLQRGYIVSRVFGDNAPYDLLVDKGNGIILKIQIKCRAPKNNALRVEKYTMTYDSNKESTNRVKQTMYESSTVDYFAVVNSENFNVYYIPMSIVETVTVIKLRLTPTKNGQTKKVRMAAEFVDF